MKQHDDDLAGAYIKPRSFSELERIHAFGQGRMRDIPVGPIAQRASAVAAYDKLVATRPLKPPGNAR